MLVNVFVGQKSYSVHGVVTPALIGVLYSVERAKAQTRSTSNAESNRLSGKSMVD